MTPVRERVRLRLCDFLDCEDQSDDVAEDIEEDRPWARLLDELYEMGGFGEFPTDETEAELDPTTDLTNRLEMDIETLEETSETLQGRGLATVEVTTGEYIENWSGGERKEVGLETDGFRLAHDRDQARRDREQERRNRELARQNRASNQAVALLTVVLAFVGAAQAVAVTAPISDLINGTTSTVITLAAMAILITTYFGLFFAGRLDFGSLTS